MIGRVAAGDQRSAANPGRRPRDDKKSRTAALSPAPGLPGRGHEHSSRQTSKETAGSQAGEETGSMTAKDSSPLVVAIDGPAGAGKSTVAARIAARFGLLNLETGAMYRAFALKAIQTDSDLDDREELDRLAARRPASGCCLRRWATAFFWTRSRSPSASGKRTLLPPPPASAFTRRIREWLVSMQRQLGADSGIVMEGRDIGTKVFPNAQVKIFLDAAAEVRGQRRYQQNGPSPAHARRICTAGAARTGPAGPHARRISPAAGPGRGDYRFHRSFARRGSGPGRSHHQRTAGGKASGSTFRICHSCPVLLHDRLRVAVCVLGGTQMAQWILLPRGAGGAGGAGAPGAAGGAGGSGDRVHRRDLNVAVIGDQSDARSPVAYLPGDALALAGAGYRQVQLGVDVPVPGRRLQLKTCVPGGRSD